MKQFYDSSKDEKVKNTSHKRDLSKTTCTTTIENPISRFGQLRRDIAAIEKDLNFYKTNVII